MARSRSFIENWMTREWWVGVSGLVGLVGAMAAVAQLLLDRGSLPVVALTAAFVLLAAAALAASARRGPEQRMILINDYREDADGYYRQYAEVIRRSQRVMYQAGEGFHGRDEESRKYGARINQATGEALDKGVELYRIQTSELAGRDWARGLASMITNHPELVHIFKDAGGPVFADVGVYDPDERDCVVHFTFKAEQTYGVEWDACVVGAVLIFGNRELAGGMKRLIVNRIKGLEAKGREAMTADEVKKLGAAQDSEAEV